MRGRSAPLRPLAASGLALLAATALLACGSSSSPSSSSSSTRSTSAATKGTQAAAAGRFTALRECLKKQGITLPQRVPGKPGHGAPPAGGAVPLGGGLQGLRLPRGVSRAKFDAALIKCGGERPTSRPGAGGRLRSPTFTKTLDKFAACLHQNGIAVPTPDTSGKGPIFSAKGLDTGSAKFRAAQKKCAPLLTVAQPGAQAAPPGAPSGAGAAGGG